MHPSLCQRPEDKLIMTLFLYVINNQFEFENVYSYKSMKNSAIGYQSVINNW